MIAAGVAIFVTVGVGMIIVQQQDVDNTTLLQSNLDIAHSLSIQKVRRIDGLKYALGITPANEVCFGKRNDSATCAALNVPSPAHLPPLESGGDAHTDFCVDPPKCLVKLNVTYTTSCTTERCESVQLDIKTEPSGDAIARGLVAKARTTTVVIPGFMFSNKTAIDFTCGSNVAQIPKSIDYKLLRMSCGAASIGTPVPCVGTQMINFTDTTKTCYPGASNNCPTGMKTFGILPGQATCA